MLVNNNQNGFFEAIGANIPLNEKQFDAALDFHGYASFTTYYVSEKVSANLKATWIHSSDFFDSVRKYSYYYDKYNQVYGVSEACVTKFLDVMPHFKNKCDTFYNIILEDEIKMKAENGLGFNDDFRGSRILSVGRLSVQKGFDVAISVVAKLKAEGYDFRWYVIGEGSERENLNRLIQAYDVADRFILMGDNTNPYPYMMQCDIYVQPSRWEGYGITLAEARILHRPIVTTNFYGAREQIIDNENGIIVEFDEFQICAAIIKLLMDTQLRKNFEMNLKKDKVNTSNEMMKFYSFLDQGIE